MPTEAEQRDLPQPWKAWHASLDPMSRQDIRDGSYILTNADGGHGTVANEPRQVDLNAQKEKPSNEAHLVRAKLE
ncbi:hypothetical protein PG985_014937 [Apiospora marii]|uniref:Hypervirulence associated protein TUDOR domain-containing protein n=1 Tax=Apiospora marii TaxID=335849 RepID=A0ABR1RIS4_9PEZI